MADRTMENERITVHFETSVDDAYGSDVLEGLKIKVWDLGVIKSGRGWWQVYRAGRRGGGRLKNLVMLQSMGCRQCLQSTAAPLFSSLLLSLLGVLPSSGGPCACRTIGDEASSHPGVRMQIPHLQTKDGIKDLPVAGLFYGIGHQPNSSLFDKWVETDEKGYVVIKHGVDTSVDGVFSAGDLHDPEWRQAITAAGSGCMAALSAERYLTERVRGLRCLHAEPRVQTVQVSSVTCTNIVIGDLSDRLPSDTGTNVQKLKPPSSTAVHRTSNCSWASPPLRHAQGIGTEFKSSQSEEPSASRATSEAARKASSDSQVNAGTSSDEDSFDPTQDKHKGQFALRKLYHSSDRPIVVLYTSPSCGPCR
eukprot:366182-Chlamydomonas_euryale.AAC.7